MDDIGFSYLVGALQPHYVIPSRRYIMETIIIMFKLVGALIRPDLGYLLLGDHGLVSLSLP